MAQIPAVIAKSARREFIILLQDKSSRVATAKGNLLKDDGLVVGDRVLVDDSHWSIEQALPRKNSIYRFIARENKRKIIAANIDLIIIIVAFSQPSYKRGLVDRYLLRACQWNIPVVLVFNKLDEAKDLQVDLSFEKERIKNLCQRIFTVSAINSQSHFGDLKNEFNELKDYLQNKTAIFLGQSGVGKSSLINTLSSHKLELKNAQIGVAGKGVHTTTWAELIDLSYFQIIDSPGIRSLSLNDIHREELNELFPDLLPYFLNCQYSDCQHGIDNHGCAFAQMPDGKISEVILSRLDSYLRFREEISQIPDWKKN